MNQAMQDWPPAHLGKAIKRTDLSSPVDLWLYNTFRETFFRRQAEYPNWAKVLAFGDKPVNLKSNRKVDEHWTFPVGTSLFRIHPNSLLFRRRLIDLWLSSRTQVPQISFNKTSVKNTVGLQMYVVGWPGSCYLKKIRLLPA